MSEETLTAAADLATVERLHERIAALEAERDAAQEAYGYLSRLLVAVAPGIVPLDDLPGLVTQADHIIAGLISERDAALEHVHKLNNLLAASQFGHELLRDDVRRAVALLPADPGAVLGLLVEALKEQETNHV